MVNTRFSNQLFRRGIFRAHGEMHKSDRHKLYMSHKFRPHAPPCLHKDPGAEKTKKPKRGCLHKTPGAEKTKKPKRVAPVGRTVPGAPTLRNAVRGCFYDF